MIKPLKGLSGSELLVVRYYGKSFVILSGNQIKLISFAYHGAKPQLIVTWANFEQAYSKPRVSCSSCPLRLEQEAGLHMQRT